MTLHMDHKGIVRDSDIKCVVCWYVGIIAFKRCQRCQNFNRYNCESCYNSIKVPLEKDNYNHICNYCGGEHKRIGDYNYQVTFDYLKKFNINNIIDKELIICNECYIVPLTENDNKLLLKCDCCKKYSYSYTTIKKSIFLSVNLCRSCNIYTDDVFWIINLTFIT